MKHLDNYRLTLGGQKYVPIVIGGMGVDISTRQLVLEAARLGGIGHISDAMLPTVVDKEQHTRFVRSKLQRFKFNTGNPDKSVVQFDLAELGDATRLHVSSVMNEKRGDGLVFINTMEKLTMNNPAGTLKVRLEAAMDGGIDGITLSAGLHLGTFSLIEGHPRFRDVKLGIIVSSVRALRLFLRKSARAGRAPDYIVVEGPLAGGHLGFGENWADYDLETIVRAVVAYLEGEGLNIPVIAAGGVFTGTDAVEMIEAGCAAVQVATRFTVTPECGLPDDVKQAYLLAEPDDIEVNMVSPTGYPMRMLKGSTALGSSVPPNCEAYGYLLDRNGHCKYIEAWGKASDRSGGGPVSVTEKICLCTQMRRFKVWTCGHYAYRLKETAVARSNGTWKLPTAEQVFCDYLFSTNHEIHPPEPDTCSPALRAS